MANLVVGAVVVLILGAAIRYIIKEKKRGVVCIGCPNAGICASKRNGNCGCHTEEHQS